MSKQFPTHIVAVDVVIEHEGKILLVKHARGNYGVPGGQVENGENLMEAAVREIKEETGADVEINRLVCISSNTVSYPGYNGYDVIPTKVMFGFTGRYLGGELQPSDETPEVLWVKKGRVLEYITVPALVERFRAYLEFDGNIRYLQYETKPEYQLKFKRNV